MMCCRLPRSICKRLSSIAFNFWWSSNRKRSIHWADRSLLCRAKEDGGLGFKDLCMMNEVFFAKQFWKTMKNPFSVVSRALKAKYFRNSDILATQIKPNSSPARKGIWSVGLRVRQWIDGSQLHNPV